MKSKTEPRSRTLFRRESTSPFVISVALGCLAAIGPFSIDAYLPAMPAIARDLRTDAGAVQLTLMAFFVGLTFGQLFYGPLSDRFGRKPLILIGLTLFTGASLACALASTAEALVAARLCQGLGGSIGMVMAIAVARDRFRGHDAVRVLALIVAVMGVAPVVAPLVGYLALSLSAWNAIFVSLATFGVFDIALVALTLPETRPPEARGAMGLRKALALYGSLVASRRCIPFVLGLAVAQAGFFAFIAGSPDTFVSHYGLSTSAYSLLFAVDVAAVAVAGRLNVVAVGRWGYRNVATSALAVYLLAACGLVLAIRLGAASWPVVAGSTFVVVASIGFVIPSLNVVVMESYGVIAGTAAAVIGAFQFAGGAIASAALGSLSDGSPNAMAVIIALCGAASLALIVYAFACSPERAGLATVDAAPPQAAQPHGPADAHA